MRDRDSWRGPIVAELAEQWPADAGDISAGLLCEVELGLTILNRVAYGQPAISAWTLFGGYPYAAALGYAQGSESQRLLQIARYYLWPLRRRLQWARGLEQYLRLEDRLRAFTLDSPEDVAQPHPVTIASSGPPSTSGRSQPHPGSRPGHDRLPSRECIASRTGSSGRR